MIGASLLLAEGWRVFLYVKRVIAEAKVATVTDLVGVIVPGGVAAGILLLVQAYTSWRQTRHQKEETVLQRYQRLIREAEGKLARAERELEHQEAMSDHWRLAYAKLAYRATEAGIELPPRSREPQRLTGPTRVARNARDSQEAEEDNAGDEGWS